MEDANNRTAEALENVASELKQLRATIEDLRTDFKLAAQNDKLNSPVSDLKHGDGPRPQKTSVVAERVVGTTERSNQMRLSFSENPTNSKTKKSMKPRLAKPIDMASAGDSKLLTNLVGAYAAAKLLAGEFSILDLDAHDRRELGISEAAHRKLLSAIEIGKRAVDGKEQRSTPEKISSSSDAIEFCKRNFARLIREKLQEEFHIVTLNTKNGIIDSHQITVGTLDASLVHPREVFRPAIRDAASSILLAHNHPSGDPKPSREDYAVTDRLTEVGKTVGIDVLDHIVMGRDGVVSIQEER